MMLLIYLCKNDSGNLGNNHFNFNYILLTSGSLEPQNLSAGNSCLLDGSSYLPPGMVTKSVLHLSVPISVN